MKPMLNRTDKNLPAQVPGNLATTFVNSNTSAGSQASVVVREEPHPAHE